MSAHLLRVYTKTYDCVLPVYNNFNIYTTAPPRHPPQHTRRALGLDCARVTLTAQGRQAPLPKSKRRQIRPPAEGWRRSERLLGKTVDYKGKR